ncbi:DUF305 domain-containing protein [Ramlibacter albus]|uniref:DUF305 domain-containing protein n=1 Tax=Ramlibacter albus TaxID=2079448 RepID=A0A923S4D4_9BURK|nr:DUF305 domain-containing protein [Ramlibacter albus]MBC5767479.1 DUF305 domain-containing protein [Ramlibacter albus]
MTQQRRHIMATAAAVIALTAGLLQTAVQAQTSKPAHPSGHSTTASTAQPPSGGMDTKAMMKENNDKMAGMSMTGKPDVDFAMMMRIHHQGAIQMSEAELKDGKDAEMKKMARKIISDQKKEIAQLDKFLAKQGHSMDKMKK